MAVAHLPNEVLKFNKNCRYLRRILKDTLFYLDEINKEKFFSKDHDGKLEVSPTEIQDVRAILDRPPSFFIFGQSRISRAFLVNEILGCQLLPLSLSLHEATSQLKILVIKQDSKSPPNIVDLLSKNCKPVTWEEILLGGNDEVRSSEELKEIHLPHLLFRDDVKMYVIPELSSKITSSVVEFVSRSTPIFLYAIKSPILTEIELLEVREIRRLFGNIPIYFVSSIWFPSDLTESDQDLLSLEYELGSAVPQELMERKRCWSANGQGERSRSNRSSPTDYILIKQITDLGYQLLSSGTRVRQGSAGNGYSQIAVGLDSLSSLNMFTRRQFQSRLIKCSSILIEV